MFYNDKSNPETDITDPHIWWKHFLCSNGSWIDESSAVLK